METSKKTRTVKRKREMQSEIYKKQYKKGNIWLEQNLTLRNSSAIMSMIEQMVQHRA